jgi:hypothetical protein
MEGLVYILPPIYYRFDSCIDDQGNFNLPDPIEGKYIFVNEKYIYTEDLVEAYDNEPGINFISPGKGACSLSMPFFLKKFASL